MEKINRNTRRKFIRDVALTGASLPFLGTLDAGRARKQASPVPGRLDIRIFSKHLQFLDYKDMASAAADMGFDGVDLTVRPKGHVLPEKVETDLPWALEQIKENGLKADMITTRITDPDAGLSKKVLNIAAGAGVKIYRMGYFRYPEEGSIPEALIQFQQKTQKLAVFNKTLGIQGAYQNHAGSYVGAALWEVWHLLENALPESIGSQFDIRHATLEGGQSWKSGLRLLKERINSLVLKDFKWEKINGKWKAVNTPIGEGMVDFTAFFKLLKQYNINVPVSMHYEYLDDNMDRDEILGIMKKDLQAARNFWSNA